MPALLAANVQVLRDHFFEHITIAYFGPNDLPAVGRERLFQSKIAHDRGNKGVISQSFRPQQIDAGDRKNFIAVHQFAVFVAEQHTIGISVVSDPDIGA